MYTMPRHLFAAFLFFLPAVAPAVEKITVVGLFQDKAVVRIDDTQRVLSVGKTSPEGVTLISANSREAVLEINGEQKTYTLGTHINTNYNRPDSGETVTIAPDYQGMYEVNGSINGFQVKFVVDTGATLIAMNKHQAKRIGLNYKLQGEQSVTETASGYAESYLVKLDEVRVGDILLTDVTASVIDSDFPSVILLGNSFLNRVNMSRKGALLMLEKTPH